MYKYGQKIHGFRERWEWPEQYLALPSASSWDTQERKQHSHLLKILREKFQPLPKKAHRDRVGCSDDQAKVSKVKDLILENNFVSAAENAAIATRILERTASA